MSSTDKYIKSLENDIAERKEEIKKIDRKQKQLKVIVITAIIAFVSVGIYTLKSAFL